MKKRILCTLLSAAMLLTSSPVVFAAETQPVKEQQTKETLPFTIKEANNDIKDESVKGWHVQITDTENAKVVADYPGLVVVRAKKTQYDDNVYLIGKSGVVQTFVVSGTDADWDEKEHVYDDWEKTTSHSSVDAIWSFSDEGDLLYYIKKPQTQTPKYDVYNATTGEYFEYDLDEKPTYYGDGKGYSAGVYRIVKDGKTGMLKNDGSILYEAVYDEVDRAAYNQHFSDGMEELDDLLYMVTQETSDEELYGFIDSKGLWDGVCRYESTWDLSGYRKKVKDKDGGYMILDLKTGEKFADQISSGGDMKALGDGCFRIVPDNLETNMDILYLTKNGNLITRAQLYNSDFCDDQDCEIFMEEFYGSAIAEHGSYLVAYDADGKKHFKDYIDQSGKTDNMYVSYSRYEDGYAIKLECADGNPDYSSTMRESTVLCSLIDAKGKKIYSFDNNTEVEIKEVRDGLIYLQYNPYGTNEINVLIYDTAENKVVLNEKNLDCSASIPRDDSSHVVLLEKDGKTALFNMLDKTFSGWDKPVSLN